MTQHVAGSQDKNVHVDTPCTCAGICWTHAGGGGGGGGRLEPDVGAAAFELLGVV